VLLALRDDVQGRTNAVKAGAENRHPAPGEKCGLALGNCL
jgi:hypothetical protein